MFMIAGTIKQSVQLAQLNQKWLEKKEKGILKQEKELSPEERRLEWFKEQAQQNRESNIYHGIAAKIESGEGLTPEEIDYLKKHNPDALRRYEEARQEKKAYENQLKNCKTKEDVERLKLNKVNGYLSAVKKISTNPYIPKSAKLGLLQGIMAKLNNVQKAHMKFVKSARFQDLPTDEELAEEKREHTEEITGGDRAEKVEVKPEEKKEEDSSEEGVPELPKAEFEEVHQVLQDSIQHLQTDSYDNHGDSVSLERDKELGKRIDCKR